MPGFYRGTKIKIINAITTLAGCAKECAAEAKCIYVAVHSSQGCILHSTKTSFVKSGAYNEGMGVCTKATLPPGCVQLPSVVDGVTGAYRGTLIREIDDVSTLAACAAKCHAEPLCILFALHDQERCLLRKTKGDFIKSAAFDKGVGECVRTTTTAKSTATGGDEGGCVCGNAAGKASGRRRWQRPVKSSP